MPTQTRTFGTATLNLLSFELDIWGRLRRATEAARANLLSEEENRKAVITTLVSDVASAYLSLRALDYQLDISQRTLATRQDSLGLVKNRQAGGVATLLDLRQSEQLVYTAAETIPTLQQQIEQTENQLSLLMGKNPGDIVRGRGLTEQEMPPEVPAGLPSALLERRPDIRAAEQSLIAANAEIDRIFGWAGQSIDKLVHRAKWSVELHAAGDATDLHSRPDQVERQARGSYPGTRADSVRKSNSDCIHRGFKRTHRPSTGQGKPNTAGVAGGRIARPDQAGVRALSRRRGHVAECFGL